MCKLPEKYTLLKFILFTHFVLCEEFDMALILEKLEHLATKVETQTSDKHEEITNVLTKLDSLIAKTKNLFSIHEEYASIPDKFRSTGNKKCDDICREKGDVVKKEVITEFIHELLQTITDEKKHNQVLRDDLRELSDDIVKDLPINEHAPFKNRLQGLDLKLEQYDLAFDSYLLKLRNEEKMLQAPELSSVKKAEIPCSEEETNLSKNAVENFQEGEIRTKLVNDSIKVLNAEILSVQREIDLTVKQIYRKPVFSP